MQDFASRLAAWQRRHGRRGLPWQGTRDPYRVWLAEVMLQQTQVAAVIPYYERFLARFADVGALAAASQDEVLRLWSGLGYYARGRNLHAAAQAVAARGGFPTTQEGLAALPGVGRSTAAAVAVFAFGRRAAILDGNAKRVFARCFGVEGDKRQWELAERLLPARGIRTYTQALMDLGATLCTRSRPACERCPVAARCVARIEDRVDELPGRRKQAPLPLRRATWYVVLHQGQGAARAPAGHRAVGRTVDLSRATDSRHEESAPPRRRSSTGSRTSGCARNRCCARRASRRRGRCGWRWRTPCMRPCPRRCARSCAAYWPLELISRRRISRRSRASSISSRRCLLAPDSGNSSASRAVTQDPDS